jgi:hypothetical protein
VAVTRDPFRNYDSWLEAPFQRAQEEGERLAEAWEVYCDDEGVDPEDVEAYQSWLASLDDRDDEREPPDTEEPRDWEPQ